MFWLSRAICCGLCLTIFGAYGAAPRTSARKVHEGQRERADPLSLPDIWEVGTSGSMGWPFSASLLRVSDERVYAGSGEVSASQFAHGAGQPAVGPPWRTSTTWFQRMGDSFLEALIGFLLVVFSLPVLWLNEKRNAKMESLTASGQSECISLTPDKSAKNFSGRLVHVTGGTLRACAPVENDKFNEAVIEAGCIRLRTTVEVYQYIEETSSSQETHIGGRRERGEAYTYRMAWSPAFNNSEKFHDPQLRGRNRFVPGLDLGTTCENCKRVEYGDVYVLPNDLVNQCTGFQDASRHLPKTLSTRSGHQLGAHHDCYFYCRPSAPYPACTIADNPEVGDVRVKFEYVREKDATIVALQDELGDDSRPSFLPYRVIPRGCYGLSEEQLKERLLAEGRKSKAQLKEEARYNGAFVCCCLPCNLVAGCCAGAFTSEIYHVFETKKSRDDCFTAIRNKSALATWLLRCVGWLMMFVGLYSFFSPVITFLSIIPLVASMGSYAIWGVCLLVTLCISAIIVSLAYVLYRPLLAFAWMTLVALVCTGPQILLYLSVKR